MLKAFETERAWDKEAMRQLKTTVWVWHGTKQLARFQDRQHPMRGIQGNLKRFHWPTAFSLPCPVDAA
jgi:hypothetical protein